MNINEASPYSVGYNDGLAEAASRQSRSKALLDDAELKRFIYDVTLHLQASRSKTPEQHDAMFQRAYKLYVKHRVDPQDPNTSN